MAKITLSALITVLVVVLVGCGDIDSGRSQLMVEDTKARMVSAGVKAPDAAETEIVEQVSDNRQAYEQLLTLLVKHYKKTGNNMKLLWAEKELNALDQMPKYNYLIEASLAGANLKASMRIPEADDLYYEAWLLERKAKELILIKNDNMLRLALDKYNQLISKHPSSDKIDDAAYRAAGIYQHFKDYSIAALYYQRAYQWDPETYHPAKYRAARILDKHLHRRAEALELYRQVVEQEGLRDSYREFAEMRIAELSKSK